MVNATSNSGNCKNNKMHTTNVLKMFGLLTMIGSGSHIHSITTRD